MTLMETKHVVRRSGGSNKCQQKLIEDNDCWIHLPKKITKNGINEFIWNDFEIRVNTKGRAIYTTKSVKAGKLLPYGGKYIKSAEFKKLLQKSKERNSYIVAANDPDIFCDAHSSNYPKCAPIHGWLGSMINQPTIT